jgi:hypothetical protein
MGLSIEGFEFLIESFKLLLEVFAAQIFTGSHADVAARIQTPTLGFDLPKTSFSFSSASAPPSV